MALSLLSHSSFEKAGKPFQNPRICLSKLSIPANSPTKMPDLVSDSGQSSVVPLSPDSQTPVVCPLHHGLKPPISRLSLSWSRGNSLRVSVFRKPAEDGEAGGKVVEVKLGDGDGEIGDAQWRRIAYGSVSPFALLQSRKNSMLSMSRVSASSSPYGAEW